MIVKISFIDGSDEQYYCNNDGLKYARKNEMFVLDTYDSHIIWPRDFIKKIEMIYE